MGNIWAFENPQRHEFTKSRKVFVAELLETVRQQMNLASAIDIGCGLGDFSELLSDRGFRVVGVDERDENVAEAKSRYPGIAFVTGNVEDMSTSQMGSVDLVLCFGLLYHLENPFRAISNLRSLTRQVLLAESMCVPGIQPCFQLVDESTSEDQDLTYVAFYPTESSLVKMLYRAGFASVCGLENLPEHPLFQASLWRGKERTMLVASRIKLQVLPDLPGSWETLSTPREKLRQRLEPLSGFLRKFRAQIVPRNPGSRRHRV